MNADEVQRFVRDLLDQMQVEYTDVAVDESGERSRIAITSSDSRCLIGSEGRHLAALNHIVRRVARRNGYTAPLSVDVNDYYRQAAERLQEKARVVAERVRTFQTAIEMEPMSSYERMVVHSALADVPYVRTDSKGAGRERHVVIHYTQQDDMPLV